MTEDMSQSFGITFLEKQKAAKAKKHVTRSTNAATTVVMLLDRLHMMLKYLENMLISNYFKSETKISAFECFISEMVITEL